MSLEIINTQILISVRTHLQYARGHLCPSSTIWLTVNRSLDLVTGIQLKGPNQPSAH